MAVKRSAPRRRTPLTKACKKSSQLRDPVTRRCRLPKSVANARAKSRARKYYAKNKTVLKKKAKSVRRKKAGVRKHKTA